MLTANLLLVWIWSVMIFPFYCTLDKDISVWERVIMSVIWPITLLYFFLGGIVILVYLGVEKLVQILKK